MRRDCASETGKAKPQIPRFWPVCRLGWFRMLKNRVAGSNTQRTLSQPTPDNKDLASTHRLGVGGWALCVECLLRALLALSASFVVSRRTTRGLAGPCKHSTHSGPSHRKTKLVSLTGLWHQYLGKRQTCLHPVVEQSEAVVTRPITKGTDHVGVDAQAGSML